MITAFNQTRKVVLDSEPVQVQGIKENWVLPKNNAVFEFRSDFISLTITN